MPSSQENNLLRLDEEKLDYLTVSTDAHLRAQRSKVIKLAVCLDRFIQIKVLDGKVKANLTSYAAKDLSQLVTELNVPNRPGLSRKEYDWLEPEEIAAAERRAMEETKEWAEGLFERMEDGSFGPGEELNEAYRARLRVWMKKGELDHVFGHQEHEVVQTHKELIQDVVPDSIHPAHEVDASDLLEAKLAYADNLDPATQKKSAKATEAKAYSELAHHASFVGTFGGQIPVVEDPKAATDSSKFSRPVKIFWETPEGETKVLKFGPRCSLADFTTFVVSKVDRDFLMSLGDEVPPFELDSKLFDCTFRPEQFGIVDAVRKYLLPGAIGGGQSGMFDKDNHTISINLSHIEIHQSNPNQERAHYQVHSFESKTHIGTLLVRLPAMHTGAALRVHLKTHTAKFAPVRNSTSIHYTIIPCDVPFSFEPLVTGTLPILVYKIHCIPTMPIPPTLSITSFPIFSTLISLMTTPTFLRRGGTIGFHLRHDYSHTSTSVTDATHLSRLLRGSDLALYSALRSLDLNPTLTAVIPNDWDSFASPVTSKAKHPNAATPRGSMPDQSQTTHYSALTGALTSVPPPLLPTPANTHPSTTTSLPDPISPLPNATVDPGTEESDTDGILRWTLDLNTLFGPAQYLDRSQHAVDNLCEMYERRAFVRSDLSWGDWERHLGMDKEESEDEEEFKERMRKKGRKVRSGREYVYVLDEIVDVQADGVCDGSYLSSMFNLSRTRRDDIAWLNLPRHLAIQGVYPTMASTPGCHARAIRHNTSDPEQDPDGLKVLATDVIGEFVYSSAAMLVSLPAWRERCGKVEEWCERRAEAVGEVELEDRDEDDEEVDEMDVDEKEEQGRKRKREESV